MALEAGMNDWPPFEQERAQVEAAFKEFTDNAEREYVSIWNSEVRKRNVRVKRAAARYVNSFSGSDRGAESLLYNADVWEAEREFFDMTGAALVARVGAIERAADFLQKKYEEHAAYHALIDLSIFIEGHFPKKRVVRFRVPEGLGVRFVTLLRRVVQPEEIAT